MENCRNFLDEIALHSNVVSPSDWRKVSSTLIQNNGGYVGNGILFVTIKGLLRKYKGDIHSIVKSIYSIHNANEFIQWNSYLSSEKVFLFLPQM